LLLSRISLVASAIAGESVANSHAKVIM